MERAFRYSVWERSAEGSPLVYQGVGREGETERKRERKREREKERERWGKRENEREKK